jgi:hypothetical protein
MALGANGKKSRKENTMKDPLTILREARALISSPESWIKGHYAASDSDSMDGLGVDDPKAVRFCVIGAVWRVWGSLPDETPPPMVTAIGALQKHTADNIPSFNDHEDTTHDDVLAAFDKAIVELEEFHGVQPAEPLVETPAEPELVLV